MRRPMQAQPLPPHDADAEQALLGSLLINGEAITRVETILQPGDFFRPHHQWIYEACLALSERHEPINEVTVAHELALQGRLADAGGLPYLTDLTLATPSSQHAEYYAQLVARTGLMRRLIAAGAQIAALGYEGGPDPDAVLDRAEDLLFRLRRSDRIKDFVSIRQIIDEYLQRAARPLQAGVDADQMPRIPTGFPALDSLLGGLHRSDLIIVAARPGVGKSSLALGFARNAAVRHRARVAMFCLEMSREQMVERLLAAESGVDSQRLRLGTQTPAEQRRILEAAGTLADAQIYFDDTPVITTVEMRSKLRRLHAEKPLDMVIVDYLQLMAGSGRAGENRVAQISEISRSLKGLARELNVPLIAMSQLSRAVESRQPHIPMLSDLRESGCLTGDTMIVNPVTGHPARMDSLLGQADASVWAIDDRFALVQQRVARAFSSGIKPVYEVRFASGRRIKATANHPFRTLHGWRALEDLSIGTSVASASYLPPPMQPQPLREAEIILLAHLLGRGCIAPNRPLHYTSADEACLEAVSAAASELFGIRPRRVQQERWWHVYLPSPVHLTHRRRHPITEWLGTLGLGLCRSWEKELPAAIFGLPQDQLALFLRHLWATDGNISRSRCTRAAIYYASTSQRLAEQLQLLLLRFGIVARIKTTRKGNYRPCYQVHIYGAEHQRRFLSEIGCIGQRGEIIPDLLADLDDVQSNPNVDTIPCEIWEDVGNAKDRAGLSWRDVAAGMGIAYNGSALFKNGVSRARLTRVAEVVQDAGLAALAASDVYWDTITAVVPLGEQPVYDLTIPGVHNFLANGIFVHNSIEQDADIVMFIYREDMYYTEEQWEQQFPTKQYPRGIARIIVAKHRNGPTGERDLYFRESVAKFESLAWEG